MYLTIIVTITSTGLIEIEGLNLNTKNYCMSLDKHGTDRNEEALC